MATSHKVLVFESKKWIGGSQKLWVENHLDPIVTIIEQLATSQGAHDGVGGVINDVVSRDGRQKRRALSVDTSLQTNDVVFGEL